MKKNLKDFSWDELNEAFSPKEMQRQGAKIGGIVQGKKNKRNGQLSKAGTISAKKQWDENRDGELIKCKKGGQANSQKSSKATIMCDINGNHIITFKNRKEAAKYVNGFASTLTNALNNPNRTYKGYKWIG